MPRKSAPIDLVKQTAELGRLPVVNFAAGGVATPADAALMMQLGWTACSWAPASSKAATRPSAQAIVQAVTHYNDPKVLAEVSADLGEPMVGINLDTLPEAERMAGTAGRRMDSLAGEDGRQ